MPQRQRRRAQINFQVEESMKTLYEEVKACGNWVTRWCAAGFLLLVEEPDTRRRAITRLRDWQERYQDADPDEIRAFVAEIERAMTGGAPESTPATRTPRSTKKARRA